MLKSVVSHDTKPLQEHQLITSYKESSIENKNTFIQSFLVHSVVILEKPPRYNTIIFLEISSNIITMVFSLSMDDDN